MTTQEIEEGKTTAVIAYMTFVGALIAFSINADSKNEYAKFHLRQAIGIHLIQISLGLILSGLNNWLISISFMIFIVVLWVYALANAIQGITKPIPLVGEKFQKWFTFI
ncbi:MAG: hypothetical protein V7767_02085 [Leeuwenhoekiella sp.]